MTTASKVVQSCRPSFSYAVSRSMLEGFSLLGYIQSALGSSVAVVKRTNIASGSSLKYAKALREPFPIVKNHVDPKKFLHFAWILTASHPEWGYVPR